MRFWGGLAVIGLAAEIIAINRSRDGKDAGTLTHTLRTVFRTDTKAGRAAFLLTLGGGMAWTATHILDHDARPRDQSPKTPERQALADSPATPHHQPHPQRR